MSGSELYDAAEIGDETLVRNLVDGGADINFRDVIFGETPLFAASEKGNTEICELLIKAGAEIGISNKCGMTILDAWPKDIYQKRVGAETVEDLIKQTNSKLLMSTGSRTVDTVKLFLIGHPSTGKTTLRKSISRGPVKAFFTEGRASTLKRDPTPGIKVKHTKVAGAGSIMFWDMAGQIEFRVTHAMLFGSSRGITVLTYNCCDTEEEQLQQLRHWLCFIKAGNDPDEKQKQVIILVGTHVDECKKKDKADDAARKIQLEFKDVFHIHEDVFLLNCCKSGGLRTLISAIGELAKPMREELMPNICDDIIKHKKQWCEGKAPILHFTQFAQKVRELLGIIDTVNDISDKHKLLRTAVGFLHDMGEVHHVSFETSNDILILKPDWLTSTIFGPIFAEPGFKDGYWALEAKAEYTVEELTSHFKNVDPNLLIDLLIHFELAFSMERFDGQRTFIIPTKLSHDHDGKDGIYWHDHSRYSKIHGIRVQCRNKTDIFSDDTFPCLQVRAMNRYRQEGLTPVLSQSCLKLLDEEVEGMIQLTEDKRAIHVAVRVPRERIDQGQNGVDQLQEIRSLVFSQLKQRSAGTEVDILYLSPNDLRETTDAVNDVHGYTEEMVKNAQAERKPLKHPVKLISELAENVNVPGVSSKLKLWRSVLQAVMNKLTSKLDPSRLAPHLDMLPENLCVVIGDTQSRSQRVANATVLLRELLQTKREDWPEKLLQGLRETNQENIAELIENEYSKQTSESSQLESVSCNIEDGNEIIRAFLLKCSVSLRKHLDLEAEMLGNLLADGILDGDEFEEITRINIMGRKIDALTDILMRKPNHISSFLEVLAKHDEDLGAMCKSLYDEYGLGTTRESQTLDLPRPKETPSKSLQPPMHLETPSESPQPPMPLETCCLSLQQLGHHLGVGSHDLETTHRKCCLVGDSCGKSCFLLGYIHNRPMTVFDTYQVETCVYGNQVRFSLWDTAGQEDYDRLRPLSYQDTDVFLISFSISNPWSLANVQQKWAPEVKHFCPGVPIMLVGLQTDLRNDEETIRKLAGPIYKDKPIQPEQGHAMARKIGAVCYVECSTLTGVGVRHVFNTAAKIAFLFRDEKKKKKNKSEKKKGGTVRKS